MIQCNNVTLRLGKRALFEDVNIKFVEGECYGIIGANGAGKSTFLRILSGKLDTTNGTVSITSGQRLSFLEQDHNKYDGQTVLDTVIQGNLRLYRIMKEKEALYAKPDFSDADGVKASELETEFAEMDGWNAESDAETLLNGLGIETSLHQSMMGELNGAQKVKVLLARALFGSPDILLLDEPTNYLDMDAIQWLEEFLINFPNTVIVVSHDRYFLNKVCTYIADIDYGKITLFAGNYDFWYESSQLLVRQMKEANKKKEEKIKELKDFISRFSANASKSKQATSRKRALEKIELDDIRPSSRKYPWIDFRPDREIGNEVLTVDGISKTVNGVKVLDHVSFVVNHDDKIAFVGGQELAKTTLFEILMGQLEPDEGSFKWGVTTSQAYFKKDNSKLFNSELNITEWLQGYSPVKDITYVRGFLGRMLFAGDDGIKKVKILSGGEKVRCQLSAMMISGANCLIFDEPTNHLDMESISALNEGMIRFPGVELFACRDHQVVQTTANRIIELLPGGGFIDKTTDFDSYLDSDMEARKRTVYVAQNEDDVEPDEGSDEAQG
jgi:ATPase subunit of ABC transporter with duplicated ATPase domains